MTPHYVVIADPGSLRYSYYERELAAWWKARNITPEIQTVDWRDVCRSNGDIGHLLPEHPAMLRIESPARDCNVFRELLRAGQRSLGEPLSDWNYDTNGWIASPRLIYHGLHSCLDGISRALHCRPHIVSPASPNDIAALFDKNEISRRLAEANVSVPESFQPNGDRHELIQQLRSRDWSKVFIKLAYGSCASGIAMLDLQTEPVSGVTTVKQLDGRFCNTFDVRRTDGEELNAILNFILNETATAQRAVPKTTLGNRNFDLRVVVLNGTVIAVVCRVSSHPMTNLHLGGQRGNIEDCRQRIGKRHWLDTMDHCLTAASLFQLPCVGIDVAFDRNSGCPYILEMNAFGDFFPNWKDENGRSIHQLEIEQSSHLLM